MQLRFRQGLHLIKKIFPNDIIRPKTGIDSQLPPGVSLKPISYSKQSQTKDQSPRVTIAQFHSDTKTEYPRDTVAQSRRVKIAQSPSDTKLLHLLGNSFSCPPTSCVLGLRPGRRTNVTAACLYLALKLDKLYAALIRCSVLWVVTELNCFISC